MDKRTEFTTALKEAVKARDEIATGTVRLIIAALKERDINARGSGRAEGINDSEIMSMLQGMIKQRQESAETYAKANRPELADRENKEIEVIKRFLPKQMNDDEVKKVIDGLINDMNIRDVREMGKLMAELKTRYAGQMDMGKASGMVKERLAS
ncbi:MAG: GatB/YqeY domain-containing protein [Proteobacteria bacterium]|nr:GatB/YqeY domain-containing protein [Pseudomonadota bacterium]